MRFISSILGEDKIEVQYSDDGRRVILPKYRLHGVLGYENGVCTPCEDLILKDKVLSAKLSALHEAKVECRSGFLYSLVTNHDIVFDTDLEGVLGLCHDTNFPDGTLGYVTFLLGNETVHSVLHSLTESIYTVKLDVTNLSLENCLEVYKRHQFVIWDEDIGRAAYCECVSGVPGYLEVDVKFDDAWDKRYVNEYGDKIVDAVSEFDTYLLSDSKHFLSELRSCLRDALDLKENGSEVSKYTSEFLRYLVISGNGQKGVSALYNYITNGGSSELLLSCADRLLDLLVMEVL